MLKILKTIKMIFAALKRRKRIFLYFFAVLIVFLVCFWIVENISELFYQRSVDKQIGLVQEGINKERVEMLNQAKDIANLQDVQYFIQNNEIRNLLSVLTEEKNKRNLYGILAVDKNGTAIARTHAISKYGDCVFCNSLWGELVGRGIAIGEIVEGTLDPLVVMGGYPIIKDEDINGAIFVGYPVNGNYTLNFKQKYLGNKAEIIFYSNKEGIIGESFSDESIDKILLAYFNKGTFSKYIDRIVNVSGRYYFVKNLTLPEIGESGVSMGGALVFTPINFKLRNIIVAVIGILIFLILTLYFKKRYDGREKIIYKKVLFISAVILAVILFFTIYLLNQVQFKKGIFFIKDIPYILYNSTLKFKPESSIFVVGSEQIIDIVINTGGESINAVQVIVDYDPSLIKINNILTTNSFCPQDLFIEKSIDNKIGKVKIVCGAPRSKVFQEQLIVAQLSAQIVAQGETYFRFNKESQILASDGLGTNVLRAVTNANYRIISPDFGYEEIPYLLPFSPTHPNSERWYNKREIIFSWPKIEVDKYVYLLDESPINSPETGQITDENTISLQVESDGIYYFHLATKKSGKIGPVSTFRVKIDSTPPSPLRIKASQTKIKQNEVVRFEFVSEDDLSGLENNYYVSIDKSMSFPSLPQLFAPFSKEGKHYLSVRVFDNAGNFSDSEIEIRVED